MVVDPPPPYAIPTTTYRATQRDNPRTHTPRLGLHDQTPPTVANGCAEKTKQCPCHAVPMTMTMARAGNRSAAEAESFSKRDRRHRPSSWTPSHHKIATDAVACAEAIAPERAKLGQMQAELRQNLQNCHTPGPIEATEVRRA